MKTKKKILFEKNLLHYYMFLSSIRLVHVALLLRKMLLKNNRALLLYTIELVDT